MTAAPVSSSMISNNDPDPLSAMIAPPANESLVDRDKRLRLEAEAKRRSDAIDEQIKQDAAKRKKNHEVKLLLLGQSGSGKSTLQKQFQLMYAPATLDLERASWRPVVLLNLIKSVRIMLETLEHEFDLEIDREADLLSPSNSSFFPTTPSSSKYAAPYGWGDDGPAPIPSSLKGKGKAKETSEADDPSEIMTRSTTNLPASSLPAAWAQEIATLRLRLTPLLSMEETLARKIGTGVQVAPGKEEVFVRMGWQGIRASRWSTQPIQPASVASETIYSSRLSMGSTDSNFDAQSTTSTELQFELDQRHEIIRQVGNILAASKDDVQDLYSHNAVRLLIKKRKLRLEESSSFFLTHLARIAKADYTPTDDDILYARLRTMGVTEHYFEVPVGTGNKTFGWRLYDVGGARGQRPSWVPYFEDATAIIFLAPISAFDQYLEEDPRVNRVDDSLQLFTLICSNPLLKNCHLVLFLNKTDVLRKKLEQGVRVKKYITSYGDRQNDYEHVSKYFLAHFRQVHRKNNVDAKRELYPHLTSVVDTRSTRQIIVNVRDAIFRDHLKESNML